jgi:hypothetical protein
MVEIVGDQEMLANLLGKRTIKNGRKRKHILVVPSGGKAGHVSAVMLDVLSRHGLRAEQFDLITATSAGAMNAIAFCAGQSHIVPGVYEHLAGMPWVFPTYGKGGWITFYEYLYGILKGEVFPELQLDLDAFRRNPARVMLAVSDLFGNLHLHDAKEAEDVFELMHAASAILPFTSWRRIKGTLAIDGAHAHPYCDFVRAIRTMLREDPDAEVCVLFLGNRPSIEHQHWSEGPLYSAAVSMSLWWSPWLLASALAMDRKIRRAERLFDRPIREHVRLCAIRPSTDSQVSPIEWRPAFMRDKRERITASLTESLAAL